jgi:hypothetical protein
LTRAFKFVFLTGSKKKQTCLNLPHTNDTLANFAGFSQEFVSGFVDRTEHRTYELGALRKQRLGLLALAALALLA